jgi:MYXO-CTERM domain-containing protein
MAGYDDDVLVIWNVIEDHNRQPGTSQYAQFLMEDEIQSPRGFRVGDNETLPDPDVFTNTALRTDVGYAMIVRRSDMQILGVHNEFAIDAFFSQLDEAIAGAHPAPAGELDFSRCEGGPFQPFEQCRNDGECIGDALCKDDVAGDLVCTPQCSSENISCAADSRCVLGTDGGVCKLIPVGEGAPPASVCDRDSDCAQGLCLPISSLGRTACRVTCESVAECGDGYTCHESACVLKPLIEEIVEEAPGGCAQTESAPLFLALLGLLFVRRRRR